jgi:hypothetical protein
VYTLFNYDYPIQNPELALRRRARTKLEEKEICRWLDKVLMLKRGSVRLTEVGIEVRDEFGTTVPLGAAADGYRATAGFVLDMLGWAMLAKQRRRKANLSGIVLVDEIEQHLHPRWQRNILRLLQERFPKVQFIVTTHSPVCAGGTADLKPASYKVGLLRRKERRTVELADRLPLMDGWRADQILASELFGYIIEANKRTEELYRDVSILAGKGPKRTGAEHARYMKLKKELKRVLLADATTLEEQRWSEEEDKDTDRKIRRLEKKLFGKDK